MEVPAQLERELGQQQWEQEPKRLVGVSGLARVLAVTSWW